MVRGWMDSMKGYKIDRAVSRALFEDGWFLDSKSHVSLPEADGRVHFYLKGDDWQKRYAEFAARNPICAVCHTLTPWKEDSRFKSAGYGMQIHHVRRQRCSCFGCLEARCGPLTGRNCHVHGSHHFTRKAAP